MIIIDFIIFILLASVLYTYLVYPILLKVLAKFFAKKIESNEISEFKPITIIISAYNEVNLIADAIHSLYKSNYPNDKIIVKVGSDGSNDGTYELLIQLKEQYPTLEIFNFDRCGKNYVLNELCKNIKTEFIFYMDADIRIRANTINQIMLKFSDINIGAVICTFISHGSNEALDLEHIENVGFKGENFYQNYDSSIKTNESRIYSTAGSLGAFYGIKTIFYEPLPNSNVADDLVSLMHVAKHKKRIIFDSEIIVDEIREKDLNNQFTRRIRITAGLLSSLWYGKFLLNPKYGWYTFFLFSHKFTRTIAPLCILIVFLFLVLTEDETIRVLGFTLYFIILVFALIGIIFEKFKIRFLPFSLSLFFVSMSLGQFLAYFKIFTMNQISIWNNEKDNK